MNQYKIVFVGDAEIGKSALSFRISHKVFQALYKPTIGAEYATVQVQGCRFNIWDTAGQETYCKLLSTVYYRGADCCALCYDLSRSSSLKNVLKWFEGIKQLDKMPTIILIGTKSDASIEVELAEIKEVETAIGAVQSFMCSAKTGDGCDEILQWLAKLIETQSPAQIDSSRTFDIQNTEEQEFKITKMETGVPKQNKQGCC
ncbi:Rab1a [Hexamita inflata]|uniref:Rab1a n=1 Tax=Hexamita inflata TaxID=28002 RepID=A0AA86PM62_9EUKA|nr:Rab1a [Hexamita inflata]